MAAWAPKSNHSTRTAARAVARSASRSATGDRMRGTVETTSEHLMVGQVLIAVPGRRVAGLHATRVLKKREGRLPCGGRTLQPVLRCPVIALAGRGGRPVAMR